MFPVMMAIGGLGLASQVVILRELFAVFAGNEVSGGVVLALWLLCEGLGGLVAGRVKVAGARQGWDWFWGCGLVSVLSSVAAAVAVILCRRVLGLLPAESVNIFALAGITLVLVFLPAATHGGLFVFGATLWSEREEERGVARIYFYEAAGTVLAAVICYFFLLSRLPGLGIVALFAGLVVAVLALLSERWWQRWVLGLVAMPIFVLVSGPNQELERRLWEFNWSGQRVLKVKDTPYAKVVTIERAGQRQVLYDGVEVLSVPVVDVAGVEEMAVVPFLFVPGATRVLVIGQGLGGLVGELLRRDGVEVAVVFNDRMLFEEIKRAGGALVAEELADPRLRVVLDDPRRFLSREGDGFDIIILSGSAPENLAENRLFSREFFLLCQSRLNEGGMIFSRCPGGGDNLPAEVRAIVATRRKTLAQVFPETGILALDFPMVFAGAGVDFSPESLVTRLARLDGGLRVLTPVYLAALLDDFRQEMILAETDEMARVNTDLMPVELFLNMLREVRRAAPVFSRFYRDARVFLARVWTVLLVVFSLVVVSGAWAKGISFSRGVGIFSSGFAGAGITLLAIFGFQLRFGSVYSGVALLLSAFMLGTVLGAFIGRRVTPLSARAPALLRRWFIAFEALLTFCALLLYPLSRYGNGFWQFLALLLVAGMCLGAQFALASRELKGYGAGRTAGYLTVLDFSGGALGGLIVGVLVVPLFGVVPAVLLLGGLKLLSLVGQLLTRGGYGFTIQRAQ